MSKLEKGKTRIIKINKKAVFEFIYETFIDNTDIYFDVSKKANIIQSFVQDDETDDFLMLIRNASDVNKHDILSPNLGKIIKKLDCTTDTMYGSKRYIELSTNELLKMIEKKK